MKRIIIDYKNLTPNILTLLSEKYLDGYGDKDIIEFKNLRNDTIEAVQVETIDTIYLVKVSSKLHETIVTFDIDDDEEDNVNINSETHEIANSDFVEDELE